MKKQGPDESQLGRESHHWRLTQICDFIYKCVPPAGLYKVNGTVFDAFLSWGVFSSMSGPHCRPVSRPFAAFLGPHWQGDATAALLGSSPMPTEAVEAAASFQDL